MYCKVHRPINTPRVSDNKGSCIQLTQYLNKEGNDKDRSYYDDFFSVDKDFVSENEVRNRIDNNVKTLKKKDDKFYMLTINPSQDELRSLIKQVTGKEVYEFSELNYEEKLQVISELKIYARGCMDDYALNFYREKIKSGSDLVWFGRVETERHYSGTDDAVTEGKHNQGDLKEGLQLHVHIIVSRMDKTQTVSLSPLTRSKGNKQILDGKTVVKGFDRTEWSTHCFERFRSKYNHIPYYVKSKKEWEEYMAKTRFYNSIAENMKRMLLSGELYYEQKTMGVVISAVKFIYNHMKGYSDFSSGNTFNKSRL